MSTEIKDSMPTDGPHTLNGSNSRWVSFSAQNGGASVWAEMRTPDFIAAVETELNGIFISKDDLPEVDEGTAGDASAVARVGNCNGLANADLTSPKSQGTQPEWHRARALAHLAMAEYLEAHPPVDQEQVEALNALVHEAALGAVSPDFARRLIATGKVKVTVND